MEKKDLLIVLLIYLLTFGFLAYLIILQSLCIQDLTEKYSTIKEACDVALKQLQK